MMKNAVWLLKRTTSFKATHTPYFLLSMQAPAFLRLARA